MKKNVMMRTATVLLVAVLLTTCAIGGTFAKYTTATNQAEASARVAYWGFNQSAAITFDNLFLSTYDDGAVVSKDGVDVIAPGTTGTANFAFNYASNANGDAADIVAPEVAYNFKIEVTGTATATTNTNIQWQLKKGSDVIQDWGTMAQLVTAIKTLSGDASGEKEYAPGNLPTGFGVGDNTYTINWKWVFEDATDATDTAMGNAATLETVSLSIKITATQVDTLTP